MIQKWREQQLSKDYFFQQENRRDTFLGSSNTRLATQKKTTAPRPDVCRRGNRNLAFGLKRMKAENPSNAQFFQALDVPAADG